MRISEKTSQDGRAPARPGLSGPAARKLPVPPRERKPALAALAVLLILGGALATTLLVMRSGDRVSAVQITQQVGAGQLIPLSAMREVQIADTGVDYVPWRFREQVATTYARVTLLPGTLLTEPMTAKTTDQVGPGKAKVGLSLKAGQMPADLKWSDIVQVIYVPAAGRGSGTAQQKVLATAARVESASSGRSGGGLVTVVVDTSIAPAIAQYASSGEIALVTLPGVK
ncbi:hypothetical protein ACIBK1_20795 [Microbispora rosea]|uniref:SAF domain-containing protein n=1 Tax=Microbispora rosea TaxID=58117 RepID=A0A1N6T6E9_9ACTN|nr:hypothetical protein [Microbispora rosea]GIH45188.1 hypothetical protein Mro03_03670 [Microbispora rosea subsp. rosea]SIQ48922.1 hypothetical protein SAMN05421833_102236 [Microbispora rosea]